MTRIDLVLETPVSQSPRARQLEGLFDVPYRDTSRVEYHGDLDLDAEPWNVGLIVGPSGSGKTQIKRHLFGEEPALTWAGASVIDDFPAEIPMDQITAACQAVGFNTIPSWLRPHKVLSGGEQFRVEMARRLLGDAEPIVIDEFTSVVDRQVAQIGSHAVQKYVRRTNRRFVAVSCHYDIIEWLQPDWVFEPATWTFTRRQRLPRPPLDCTLAPVTYATWNVFAPFHYLTSSLHKAAQCFALFVGDEPAALAAMLYRPSGQQSRRPIWGLSRLVTLPDWQGLGLAFVLTDRLASLYAAQGSHFHTYPAHPSLVRSFDRSDKWQMIKRPGTFSGASTGQMGGATGGRPCAVFRWRGGEGDPQESQSILGILPQSRLNRSTTSSSAAG